MKAWSYSSLTDFEGCPRRYHMVRDLKVVPFKETEATLHGKEVHKALELRVKDKTPLPEKYKQYEAIAAKFDKPGVFTEQQIALNRSLQPTGWWDKDCWVRGVIDVGVTAKGVSVLADYKTGKVKPDSSQMELFAALKMQEDKSITEARTLFVWLAHGKTSKATYKKEGVPVIWEGFIQRVQRMELAYEKDKWLPKASPLCGWCPLSKEHCEFRGSK
jgi:hypothetical protein